MEDSKDLATRTWQLGRGNQDVATRTWPPEWGQQDLATRMRPPRWGHQEQTLILISIMHKKLHILSSTKIYSSEKRSNSGEVNFFFYGKEVKQKLMN